MAVNNRLDKLLDKIFQLPAADQIELTDALLAVRADEFGVSNDEEADDARP